MNATAYQALQATLGRDLLAFLPELILCGTIVLMLVLRLFHHFDRRHMGGFALILTFYGLVVSFYQWTGSEPFDPRESGKQSFDMFAGLLVYDNFTIFLRLFLFSFTTLIIWLTMMTKIPDREDSADFYCLLLGATLGMSLMASANHLLMVFIGIEMASLPSYGLAGFLKGKRRSSEAALKYVVYGGGAAGIMLYGISLIAGKYGTGYLPDVVAFIARDPKVDVMVLLGMLFILIGIGFKLAAVPFHFWCPDVFEGAAAEVAGFLSVASKGAALALLARLVMGLGGLTGLHENAYLAWRNAAPYLVPAIAIFAAVTVTFGNLAAYAQTNLKRLLAYSTIAHAGFMMMGLATLTRDGASAVLFYLMVYLVMNLGAFAVVAFLRNLTGSEDMRDHRGLVQRNPLLVVTLGVFLLSLLGIPPLAGFAAKFQIFRVLFDGAQKFNDAGQTGLGYTMYALVVIGGINTVISLVYYIKVMKVMALERPLEEVEGRPSEPLDLPLLPSIYAGLLAAAIFVGGILWGPLADASDQGVTGFAPSPGAAVSERGGRP
jgi:NADH-quinone oxidoreductase subunit N